MNKLSLTYAVGAIVAAVSFVAIAHAQIDSNEMDHGSMPIGDMSASSKAYDDAMAKMDEAMAQLQLRMTGKPGVDFAMMMIPHHQSAIDMAKAYLTSGENDPELTKLSNEIIAAQETEIAFLKEWLKRNAH